MNNTNKFLDKIEELKQKNLDISIRKLSLDKVEIYILYIQQLTNREILSYNIIKPILLNKSCTNISIDKLSSSVIYIDDIKLDDDENKIIDYILKANSIIISSNDNKYIIANTMKIEQRKIKSPKVESTLRGADDSFNENIDSNLSLIRYRIKDINLRIDKFYVGKRSKTNVVVVYIKDIVNPKIISTVKRKLENINIDAVFESGYIHKFILNNAFDLFPQAGIVERSDSACTNIVNGKICVLVEGISFSLIIPKTFIEFLDASDDHYDNIYISVFSKTLRILSILISLTLSSLYVLVVAFDPDILPPQYILIIATSRATVPFNAVLEALIMEFVAEVLREASIRLPQQIGPAISIVGAIVIGQAAVAAGLVSSLVVIIVSLSIMTSFAMGDYSMVNPIRVLKYIMILLSGGFGIFGFTMGLILITINLCSMESFGVSYLAPLTPFNLKDIINFFFSDITLAKKRPEFLHTKDKTRQ
ncbi:spore germination protein [Maledivibacter halophilus]|uniref:Spore germination protein KA n=1 Tax=Maledivibacter halophilus TaxID=36842 RepID=A0A1T5MBY9_9FIRM|nr:spore germination protein [Maledivibacter halophilus]SKC85603.1 spore germination protein KA [Maledivibacter halophilus]